MYLDAKRRYINTLPFLFLYKSHPFIAPSVRPSWLRMDPQISLLQVDGGEPCCLTMTTEVDNVTSSYNATSRDQQQLMAPVVIGVIVRYVFPVVVIVGTVALVVYCGR